MIHNDVGDSNRSTRVDVATQPGYTYEVVTKSASPRKARSRKPTRRQSSAGSWASLAAAVGSILALGGLLYASCKASSEPPKPEPVATQAPMTPPPAITTAATAQAPTAAPKVQKEDWNDTGIAWQSYEAGITKAKSDHKPVCLVFFTNWCPHCRNYSKIFSDPRVVARAKEFVMIRLNADDVPEISNAHSPDGSYVPRTFFLSSDGKILAGVQAPRPQYVHFYDENNPESLLAGMEAALKKIRAM